jgi:hypothetical protein
MRNTSFFATNLTGSGTWARIASMSKKDWWFEAMMTGPSVGTCSSPRTVTVTPEAPSNSRDQSLPTVSSRLPGVRGRPSQPAIVASDPCQMVPKTSAMR